MVHLPLEEIYEIVNKAKTKIAKGDIYVHYSNPENKYVIDEIGLIEATNEPAVIYRPMYGDTSFVWVRPLSVFLGEVEVDGKKIDRFTKVSSSQLSH